MSCVAEAIAHMMPVWARQSTRVPRTHVVGNLVALEAEFLLALE